MEELEREKLDLKEKLKTLSKKALLEGLIKAPIVAGIHIFDLAYDYFHRPVVCHQWVLSSTFQVNTSTNRKPRVPLKFLCSV